MKRISLGLLAGASAWCAGCAGLSDSRVGAAGRGIAQQTYRCQAARYANTCHPYDFERGFIDGFSNVADGEDGCPPPLPPKRYWGASYQNAVGQDRVKAWYEGFREGAAAAKQSGAGGFATFAVPKEHLLTEDDQPNTVAAPGTRGDAVLTKPAGPLPPAGTPKPSDAKSTAPDKPEPKALPKADAAKDNTEWRPAAPETLTPIPPLPAPATGIVRTSAETFVEAAPGFRSANVLPTRPLPASAYELPMPADPAAEVELGAPAPAR